jgi:hypothetical protein
MKTSRFQQQIRYDRQVKRWRQRKTKPENHMIGRNLYKKDFSAGTLMNNKRSYNCFKNFHGRICLNRGTLHRICRCHEKELSLKEEVYVLFVRRYFFIMLLLLSRAASSGQGTNTYFGSNPVQYTTFEWKFVGTDNFDAYYYGENQELAEYVLKAAENQLKVLENTIDYRLGGRSKILIYSNQSDIRQSNLFHSDLPFNPGGYTYGIENKVIVYTNGSKVHLEQQLRYGISQMLVNELMYGGSFQEKIQASTLLYLPEWFYMGLLSYLSNPWDTYMDSEVKDAFAIKKFHRMNLLSPTDAVVAGHSWWHFIAEKYGRKSISDILYLTRVSKNYESAFIFVLGMPVKAVFREWITFYEQEYSDEPGNVPLRGSKKLSSRLRDKTLVNAKLSPDGRYTLLSSEDRGKMEVWLVHLESDRTTRVLSQDFSSNIRLRYPTGPVIVWKPEGNSFYALLHRKGKLRLLEVSLKGTVLSDREITGPDGISWADHHPEEDKLVLSAYKKGSSDILMLDIPSLELTHLTNDPFDDLFPSFSQSGRQIFFSSSRGHAVSPYHQTAIPLLTDTSSYDIYSLEVNDTANELKRITFTPYINEIQPREYFKGTLAYLSDNNGIYNLYVSKHAEEFVNAEITVEWKNKSLSPVKLLSDTPVSKSSFRIGDYFRDSTEQSLERISIENNFKETFRHYPLSDYSRNVLIADVSLTKLKELEVIRYQGNYYLNVLDVSTSIEEDAAYNAVKPTSFRRRTGYQAFVPDSSVNTALVPQKKSEETSDASSIVPGADSAKAPYFFQSGFPDIPRISKAPNKKEKDVLLYARPGRYKANFFPDYFVTQLLDNSVINTYFHANNSYAPLMNGSRQINARIEASISDLFKDHTIKAGGRLPLAFNGTDFYIDYQNRKYKHDFGIIFFRQSRLSETAQEYSRAFLHELRPYYIKPLISNLHLRLSAFYREDRAVLMSTDPVSATGPDGLNRWLGSKLELIYDKSYLETLNFPSGIRFKAFWKTFNNTVNGSRSVQIAGFDLRIYKKIHSKILWANRLSFNGSFGASKTLYYVGGTENWLRNAFNEGLGTHPEYSYSMVSLGNGIRGFKRNIRNGASYLAINSEIRIPVTAYLSKSPVSYDLLRNLQLIGFYDIGSAWNGWSPFTDQHYNTRVVDQGSVKITVRNRNNPFVSGFGTGLRSRIFGYYFRCDLAWGIENGVFADKMWMFSLGYDF